MRNEIIEKAIIDLEKTKELLKHLRDVEDESLVQDSELEIEEEPEEVEEISEGFGNKIKLPEVKLKAPSKAW